MSVIVHKDGVVAADRRLTISGWASAQGIAKIECHRGMVVGGVGNPWELHAFMDWVEEGRPTLDREAAQQKMTRINGNPSDGAECDLVLFHEDGRIHHYDLDFFPTYLEYQPFDTIAIGSGRVHAIPAMMAGASAVEAVRIACELDQQCGNGIDWIKIGTRQIYRENL